MMSVFYVRYKLTLKEKYYSHKLRASGAGDRIVMELSEVAKK
jgi:hypothetical protein